MTSDLQALLLADLQQFAVPPPCPLGSARADGGAPGHPRAPGAAGAAGRDRFSSSGEQGVNLILRLPGGDAQLAPLLVGDHYDGPLHSLGADDNTSGVASLLELARRLAKPASN